MSSSIIVSNKHPKEFTRAEVKIDDNNSDTTNAEKKRKKEEEKLEEEEEEIIPDGHKICSSCKKTFHAKGIAMHQLKCAKEYKKKKNELDHNNNGSNDNNVNDSSEDDNDGVKTTFLPSGLQNRPDLVAAILGPKRRKISLGKNDEEIETETESESEDDDDDMDDGWKDKLPGIDSSSFPKKFISVLDMMDSLLTDKEKGPVESFSKELYHHKRNGKHTRGKLRRLKKKVGDSDSDSLKLQWHKHGKEWCPETKADLITFVEVLREIAILQINK